MSQVQQPIDHVKRGIEGVLPNSYMVGIMLVYVASALVMSFLLYPSFFAFIGHDIGAMVAVIAVSSAIQFMRFLIIFTDSLTAGKNDSGGIVKLVSLCMLVLSVIEVWHAVSAVGAAVVVAVTCSSLMLAGCVLELLFVKKLNRRDLELEAQGGNKQSNQQPAQHPQQQKQTQPQSNGTQPYSLNMNRPPAPQNGFAKAPGK